MEVQTIVDTSRQAHGLQRTLLSFTQALLQKGASPDLSDPLEHFVGDIARLLELDAVCIIRLDSDVRLEDTFFGFGFSSSDKAAFLAYVARLNMTHLSAICASDMRQELLGDIYSGRRSKLVSMALIPLHRQGLCSGILCAFRKELDGISPALFSQLGSLGKTLWQDLAEVQAYRSSSRDDVTGLMSRYAMTEVLKQEFDRARRYQAPLAAMVVVFEGVCLDSAGAPQILKKLGQRLATETRRSDYACRLMDSTFLLVLPMCGQSCVADFAERLCEQFASLPIVVDDNRYTLAVSIGMAVMLDSDESSLDMVMRADLAVSSASTSGYPKKNH